MVKIYLSPSNQDDNIYAVGNTNEMIQCNRIADAAETALKRNGFEVLKAPMGQAMNVSISQSNAWGADLHVAIHTNAGGGQGTEIFIYNSSASLIADDIINELSSITLSGIIRGVKLNQNLAELNSVNAMSVYIEVDFHDNANIAQWIIDNTSVIGEAICKGICKYYNVSYNSGEITSVESDIVWEQQGNNWIAFKDEIQVKGWLFDDGKWYYFDPINGHMKTGWVNDGRWYYLKPGTGEMVIEWFWDDVYQSWYYFDPENGNMVTGWLDYKGYKYYLKPDGKMASNEYIQDGGLTKYWLDVTGKWIP